LNPNITTYNNGDTVELEGTLLDSGTGVNILIGDLIVTAVVTNATSI
jgi:hypothetical protein